MPRQNWSAKPPVGTPLDRSHPLSQGLVFLFPMNEGGGLVTYDAVRGLVGRMGSTLTWAAGPSGPAVDFPLAGVGGSTNHITVPDIEPVRLGGPLTIGMRHSMRTTGGSGLGRFLSREGATNGLIFYVNSGYMVQAGGVNSSGHPAVATGWATVSMSFDPAVRITYLVNGTPGAAISALSASGTGAGSWAIGNRTAGARGYDGLMSMMALWNRALTMSEQQLFQVDPFCMFAPPVWRRYFILEGGGGATEAVAGGVAGVSTVSGTLSSTVPVAGAAAGVSTASGAVGATVPVAAASAGTSTVGGTVTVAAGVAGASAGVSTVGGTLSSTVPISAASAGVSTVGGTVRATVAVLGAVAGVSTVGGSARATVPISAASAGVSTVSGTLASQGQELAVGAVAGVSTVGGSLSATVPISAASAGVSTASADLTVTPAEGSSESVAGASAGVSTVAGTLSGQASIAALVASTSSLAAALRAFRVVAGSAASVSTVSANLSGGEELLPAIRAASSDGAYGTVVSSDVALTGVTADRVLMGATASDSEG